MGIVFFCQSCGARFEVEPRLAGKRGRCTKCGQSMSIPRADELASMVAMPALAAAAAGGGGVPYAGAGTSAEAGGGPAGGWLGAPGGKVKLAPITLDRVPTGKRGEIAGPSPVEIADSKPYALVKQPRGAARGRGSGPAGAIVRLWRGQLGNVQRLFRKLNEAAYLVSIPFIVIFLLGAVVRSRPLALLGATVVILLNIGRLVAGVGNLAVIPFRDGIDFQKMKKPFRRVVEPVLTIGVVVAAFAFIPWLLAPGQSAKGSIAERLRSGAESLEKDVRGQVEKGIDKAKGLADSAGNIDLEKLPAQAQEKLKGLTDQAQSIDVGKAGEQVRKKVKRRGSPSGEGPAEKAQGSKTQSPAAALGGLLKELRETIKETQKQP